MITKKYFCKKKKENTDRFMKAFKSVNEEQTDLCCVVLCTGLLDHVTVLIGIASGGKPVGGVIHQPYYNYQNPG